MGSCGDGAKQDALHWMCRLVDAKTKLSLAEFYRAGVVVPEDGDDGVAGAARSCADDRRRQNVAFEGKGPYVFQLYTPLDHEPRCAAVDVFFEEPVTVAEIKFRNYYVADVSVLMKFANRREWEMTVQRRRLMPWPHFERGARSFVTIAPEEWPPRAAAPADASGAATVAPCCCCCCGGASSSAPSSSSASWPEVSEIRLVLRQPSPNWKRFYVENLAVYGERLAAEPAESGYLAHLVQRTTEALKMERKNERRSSSTMPFHIGTHGYEIDKLHKF